MHRHNGRERGIKDTWRPMTHPSENNPDIPAVPAKRTTVGAQDGQTTVYFDGSCPLCSAEIRHYGAQEGSERLRFVDVTDNGSDLGPELAQNEAMARFHIRRPDGQLLSGARAFVAIWRVLPAWRWAARLASIPGVTPMMEAAYRMFLPVRPLLAACVGRTSLATGTGRSKDTSDRNRR